MRDLRSVVVKVVIGSFSVAALMGIAALLGAGGFGDTQGRILATTVVVGIESLAVLCYLGVAGRSTAWLGLVGGLVSLVPFGIALSLTWGDDLGGETLWRTFGVGVTIAASLAQACLLLSRDHRSRTLLGLTLVAAMVVAGMIIGPILDQGGDDDLYWRLFGVVAILDTLGTIVLIALSLFGGAPARTSRTTDEPLLLSDTVASRLRDAAARRGTSPDDLLIGLLDDLD